MYYCNQIKEQNVHMAGRENHIIAFNQRSYALKHDWSQSMEEVSAGEVCLHKQNVKQLLEY